MKARFGSLTLLLAVATCALRVKEQPPTAVVDSAPHLVVTTTEVIAETPPDAGVRQPAAVPLRSPRTN